MKFPYSSRVCWFTFRIIDEILKRNFLKRASDMFMPVDLKQMGMKLSLSTNILSMSPQMFYET